MCHSDLPKCVYQKEAVFPPTSRDKKESPLANYLGAGILSQFSSL
jgi:hypothetical protein